MKIFCGIISDLKMLHCWHVFDHDQVESVSGRALTWPLDLPFKIFNTNLQSSDARAFAAVNAAIHRIVCGF
jgi:hypothetical protein